MSIESVPPVRDEVGLVPFGAASRRRYRTEGIWTGKTLPAELVAAAETFRDRTILVTEDGRWTFAELFDEAIRFAGGLGSLSGVRPGDPVMLQMGNVVETVVSYLGCLLAGARPVCTLPQHGTREIGLLAEHVGASHLISQADFRGDRLIGQAEQLLAEGPIKKVIVARGEALSGMTPYGDVVTAGEGTQQRDLPFNDLDPTQIAVFQLSGGTTGLPKVAPRLHEDYTYNSRAWADVMGYDTETVLLYALPLMHNAGISLALQPGILAGSKLVLAATADTDLILDLIDEHHPDVLPLMPPAVAIRLLDNPRSRQSDLSSVKEFVVGGQRLTVEVAERLRDDLGIQVRQMFGMAEGMFLVTPAGASEHVRHRTVGAPISPADEIRILEPGHDQEVADGEVGELAARGPYTIRGYYRAGAHNSANFTADGFYRTGDLARRQVTFEGTFYSIDGRIKDVINRGVEKIHAEEVEELIVGHPGVATAALVSMPDRELGERACAYLIMKPGYAPLTVATLGEHLLAQGLAKYKVPERVEIVRAFPLTNVGKVSKKALREDIAQKVAAESGSRR